MISRCTVRKQNSVHHSKGPTDGPSESLREATILTIPQTPTTETGRYAVSMHELFRSCAPEFNMSTDSH